MDSVDFSYLKDNISISETYLTFISVYGDNYHVLYVVNYKDGNSPKTYPNTVLVQLYFNDCNYNHTLAMLNTDENLVI